MGRAWITIVASSVIWASACATGAAAGSGPAAGGREQAESSGGTAQHNPSGTPCPPFDKPASARPTRDEVMAQMSCIKEDVSVCADDTHRVIQVSYSVAGKDGRAKVRRVELPHDGSGKSPAADEMRCIEASFARVRFVPFSEDEFKVSFPFKTY